MNVIKIALWCLVLVCAGVIWGFSSQDAEVSAEISREVTTEVVEKVVEIVAPEKAKEPDFYAQLHYFIRESAHVFLYLCLGFLAALLCRQYPLKHPVFIPMIGCVLFSLADEINQKFFTVGRSFQMIDLYKDWAGSLVGVLLVWAGYMLAQRCFRREWHR